MAENGANFECLVSVLEMDLRNAMETYHPSLQLSSLQMCIYQ